MADIFDTIKVEEKSTGKMPVSQKKDIFDEVDIFDKVADEETGKMPGSQKADGGGQGKKKPTFEEMFPYKREEIEKEIKVDREELKKLNDEAELFEKGGMAWGGVALGREPAEGEQLAAFGVPVGRTGEQEHKLEIERRAKRWDELYAGIKGKEDYIRRYDKELGKFASLKKPDKPEMVRDKLSADVEANERLVEEWRKKEIEKKGGYVGVGEELASRFKKPLEMLPFSPARMLRLDTIKKAAERWKSNRYVEDEYGVNTAEPDWIKVAMDDPTLKGIKDLGDEGRIYTRYHDKKLLEDYMKELEFEERPKTTGAKIGGGMLDMLPWMAEFYVSSGLLGAGEVAAKAAETGVRAAFTRGLEALGEAGLRTAISGHRIGEAYVERQMPDIGKTEEGKIVVGDKQEGESASAVYAVAGAYSEVLGEMSGETITKVAAKLPLLGRLIKGISKATGKASSEVGEQLAKGGFSDLFGEWGEERFTTTLHAIIGDEDFGAGKDATWRERLSVGLKEDMKNIGPELVILGAIPAGGRVVGKYVGKYVERREKQKFYKEVTEELKAPEKEVTETGKPLEVAKERYKGGVKTPEGVEEEIVKEPTKDEIIGEIRNRVDKRIDERGGILTGPVEMQKKDVKDWIKRKVDEREGNADFRLQNEDLERGKKKEEDLTTKGTKEDEVITAEEAEKRQGKIGMLELGEEERAAEKLRKKAFEEGGGAIDMATVGALRREELGAPREVESGEQGDMFSSVAKAMEDKGDLFAGKKREEDLKFKISEKAKTEPETGGEGMKYTKQQKEMIDEIKSVNGEINKDGTITLYHATTKEKAEEIIKSGILKRPEDAPDKYGVYAGTNASVSESYGDGTVVKIKVPIKDLNPDDIFPGRRMDFSIITKGGKYKPISVEVVGAKVEVVEKPEEIVGAKEKLSDAERKKLIKKLGKTTVKAGELKAGDFYRDADDGVVYFVKEVAGDEITVQDGKKKEIKKSKVIHLLGKLNDERATFAGGQSHPRDEGDFNTKARREETKSTKEEGALERAQREFDREAELEKEKKIQGAGQKAAKLTRGQRARMAEKLEKLPGAAEKLEKAQAPSKKQSEMKVLRKQVERLENVYGLDDATKSKYKRKITLGRTDKVGEMRIDERQKYVEMLQTTDHKKPETQRIMNELKPDEVKDPVLREFVDEVEGKKGSYEGLVLKERLSSSEIVKKAIGIRPRADVKRDPIRVRPSQFWDIASWAFHDLTMKTGVPFYEKGVEIENEWDDVLYEVKNRVLKAIEKSGLKLKDLTYNAELGRRIFYYLDRGDELPGTTDGEIALADEMKRSYKLYELGIKMVRHRRYMGTGELPPDINNEGGKRLMEEGAAVFKKGDEQEYYKWLDSVRFGVRAFYVPHHEDKPEDLQIDKAARRAFGRGQTKTREGQYAEYNPSYPIIGDWYRYMLKMERIMRMEPMLRDMSALFNEHKEKIDPDLIENYFNNYFGIRKPMTKWARLLMAGQRQFYKVRIPPAIVNWVNRNLMQPAAMTLPKVMKPSDPLFWKHFWKLLTGHVQMARNLRKGPLKIFGAKPWMRDYFDRYVTSMDNARTELMLNERGEFEMKPLRGMMRMMDEVSKYYGIADDVNRWINFLYAMDVGADALKRYGKNPTKRNYQRFLDLTGSVNSPLIMQQNMAREIDKGNYREACFIAAKWLSDSTQGKYKLPQRGLGFQEVGGVEHVTAPIITFWKMTVQDLWKEGIKPTLDYAKAKAQGKSTSYDRHRASRALLHMLHFMITNYAVNKIYQFVYGVDAGQYGWNILVYTPGGPVLRTVLELTDIFRRGVGGEKGFLSKMIAGTDKAGDLFVPFYQLLEKMASIRGRTESGTIKMQYQMGFLKELQRHFRNRLSIRRKGEPADDTRKWIELTGAELARKLILNGEWSPRLDDMARTYKEYYAETDYDKAAKLKNKLEKMKRQYPISTKRQKEYEGRREETDIFDIAPGLKEKVE
mgnify:CR=1 FL=1